MIGFIITMIIVGFIAGALARFLVPGRDPMSWLQTLILGVIGSFVGGFLAALIFNNEDADGTRNWLDPAGIIGSIIGAIIVLVIYTAVQRPGATAS